MSRDAVQTRRSSAQNNGRKGEKWYAPPRHGLQVPAPASASSLPPPSLVGTIDVVGGVSDASLRVPAAGAGLLLDVEGALAAPPADDVRLVVPLTLGGGTLGL